MSAKVVFLVAGGAAAVGLGAYLVFRKKGADPLAGRPGLGTLAAMRPDLPVYNDPSPGAPVGPPALAAALWDKARETVTTAALAGVAPPSKSDGFDVAAAVAADRAKGTVSGLAAARTEAIFAPDVPSSVLVAAGTQKDTNAALAAVSMPAPPPLPPPGPPTTTAWIAGITKKTPVSILPPPPPPPPVAYLAGEPIYYQPPTEPLPTTQTRSGAGHL